MTFDSVEIGNDGIGAIREALDMMPRCTYVKLDSCKVDNEVMAQLRNDYPEKTVVWRVFAGKYNILTDEEMLRMTYSLDDKDAKALIYCNNIKYLDVTSSKITNISFAQYMPKLECVILTLTKVTDLSPLTNCPNLTWLELSSCTGIKDLSALSSLQNLKYLCVSNTKVSDLSALENVPLERLNCVKSGVKTAALESFIAKHPDCVTTSKGSALGFGWRYEDKEQKVPFPYYAELRKIFRYDDKNFSGNRK
jgi:Leucine-rich repeat (LRR) protein